MDTHERGEATTVIVLTVLTILGLFGAVKYEDHLARERMAEAKKAVEVEQNVDWSEKDYELK